METHFGFSIVLPLLNGQSAQPAVVDFFFYEARENDNECAGKNALDFREKAKLCALDQKSTSTKAKPQINAYLKGILEKIHICLVCFVFVGCVLKAADSSAIIF